MGKSISILHVTKTLIFADGRETPCAFLPPEEIKNNLFLAKVAFLPHPEKTLFYRKHRIY